jgi:maleylacetoacetate isomerase
MHPLNNMRVLKYLRSPLGHDEDAVDTWYRHWIAEGFHGLEEEAKRASGDGRHMFGTEVTLADVCLVPQMFNARRFNCNVAPFPTLCGICGHLETLPGFVQAAPDAQPDAS